MKFIDPEQLVDYMRYYKEAGLTEYQDVSFNYARMTNYAPFNPKIIQYQKQILIGPFSVIGDYRLIIEYERILETLNYTCQAREHMSHMHISI